MKKIFKHTEQTKRKISQLLKKAHKEGRVPTAFKKGNSMWKLVKNYDKNKGVNNPMYKKKIKFGSIMGSKPGNIIKKCLECFKLFNTYKCLNKKFCCDKCYHSFVKGKTYEERFDKEMVKKYKRKLIIARSKKVLPKKDTSIEVKIQNFLKQLEIEFFTHQYMKIKHGYQCDILIPSMNLVIECDGNYWHKYPTGKDIDHIRTKELIEKGFKVLRLWEREIRKMRLKSFKEVIYRHDN